MNGRFSAPEYTSHRITELNYPSNYLITQMVATDKIMSSVSEPICKAVFLFTVKVFKYSLQSPDSLSVLSLLQLRDHTAQ